MDRRLSLTKARAFSGVARLLTSGAIICAGCFAHTQQRPLEEIGAATVFYSVLLAFLARPSQARRDGWLYFVLLLAGFAVTAHALSRNVETGIPALRTVFRASFHLYSMFILFSFWKRRNILQATVESTLWLGSFLYLWSGVWNPAGHTPLTLALSLIALEKRHQLRRPALGFWRKNRVVGATTIVGGGALLAAWSLTPNSMQSLNQLQLYYAGGLIALLTAGLVASRGLEAVLRSLRIAFVAFAILQLVAVARIAEVENDWAAIFQKKLAIAGLNANDAAGYLLLYFPVLAAELKVIRKRDFWLRCLTLLQIVVCAVLILATGARTAILLLGPLLLSLIFLNARHRLSSIAPLRSVTTHITIVLALGALVGGVVLWQEAGPARFSIWSEAMPHSLLERVALWSQGLYLLQQEPLLGIGPRNHAALGAFISDTASSTVLEVLGSSLQSAGVHQHVHNTLLQCALDGGLLFSFSVLLIISYLVSSGANLGLKSWIGNGVSVAAAGALLQGVLNFHFMHLHYVATLATMAGLVVALDNKPVRKFQAAALKESLTVVIRIAFLAGLLTTLYFVTLSALQWQTLRSVGNSLYLTAHGNWSIVASDDADFVARAQGALNWTRLGRRLAPKNPEFSQLEGSLLLAIHDINDDPFAAAQAIAPLQHCARYGSAPAYCWSLLGNALRLGKRDARAQIEFAQEKARSLDPFRLLEKGYARRY